MTCPTSPLAGHLHDAARKTCGDTYCHGQFGAILPRRTQRAAVWLALVCALMAFALPGLHAAQVVLTWQDNSNNEDGFRIERATGSGAYAQIGTTSANIVNFTDTTAVAGTTYNYRVHAYNTAGNSANSNVATVSIPSSGNTAPTISNIANQTISTGSATAALSFTIGDAETSAASLSVSGSSSNTSLVTTSGIVFGGSGASRTVTVTPVASASGTATITVTVSDGTLTASDTFILTVNAITNTAPTITNIPNQTVNEDSATAALAFTIGDAQTPPASLVLSVSSSNTTLVPNSAIVLGGSGGNRTVTVTPVANLSGSATITITVSDGSLTANDPFTLTVNPVNDVPTISNIANQTIAEDANTGALSFTVGDVETSAGSLSLFGSSSNPTLVPNGAIAFGGSGANRTVTITPVTNVSGSATITITVSDGTATATDTIALTVNAVNDAPWISDVLNQVIDEGTATSAVDFSISDAESAVTSLTLSASSSNTTLVPTSAIVFGGTGTSRTVTVTPVDGRSGTATITLNVSDGSATSSDTFVVTVNAVNAAPTISNLNNVTIDEDTSTGAIGFTIGDAETPAGSLTVTAISSNATLVPPAAIALGGSGANRTVAITPAANRTGSTTITLAVSDGAVATTESFIVNVNAINDAPTISNVANQTIAEDASTGTLSFTVGDAESAAGGLVVSATSSNAALVSTSGIVLGGSGANRTITITPAANQAGSATITITVTDGSASATDTFALTVTGTNDAPTISNIANQTTNEDTPTSALAFTIGDNESAATSLTVTGSSSNTTLVPNAAITFGGSGATRTVTVTPAANQTGSTTITVTVSDGTSSDSDTFTLSVNGVNDAPTISAITGQTTSEDTATAAVAFTIGDAETAAGSLTLSATSSDSSLVPFSGIAFGGSGASRSITITPAANQSGSATITVIVSDGTASTSSAFNLAVNAVNDAPTITSLANQSTSEDVTTPAFGFVVSDAETAAGSLTVSASSSNTTLVPVSGITFGGSGANRTVAIDPAANQTGSTTITVTVSDGTATGSDTFVLTVGAVNDAPTITAIGAQSTSEDSATTAIAFTIGDDETGAGSLTLTGTSSNLSLVPISGINFGGSGASRTVIVTPASNQSGSTSITVTVSDGAASTNTSFNLTVSATNDAPIVSDIANQSINEDSSTSALAFTISDAESAPASLTVSATSSNTTLVPNSAVDLGGSGANRTVTVSPAANQTGTTTITLTVGDGSASTTETFTVTVGAVNDAPTITSIANQSVNEDASSAAIAFTIGDTETAASGLTLTGFSSDLDLVPLSGITFAGSGASRTVTVTPAANQSGSATITVSVSDAIASTSRTFNLTVNAANDAPTITDVTDRAIPSGTSTGALAFSIDDVDDVATSLTVTASSSNTTVVPTGNIVFGGTGTNRTVTVTPAGSQLGTATITITVSDGSLTSTDSFVLTVTAPNTPPWITNMVNHAIDEDGNTGPIVFAIGDAETPGTNLILTATSSVDGLVTESGFAFGYSGAYRSITVTPAPNASGITVVTVTVSDGSLAASDSFVLTVSGINDFPTISNIADRTIAQDGTSGPIAFTVGDVETPVGNLSVTGSSSNDTLVPVEGLVFGGSGANRTLTITPAPNRTGTATITVTVRDGQFSRSDSFVVTVNPFVPANQPPTISPISNQFGNISATLGPIPFTVGDIETGAASLTISATSSNPALIPASGITLAGSGANRMITLVPVTNQSGGATITVAVNDGTDVTSTTFIATIAEAPPLGARMLNLSTRVLCRPNQEALIPGFVINGTMNKRILLRAVGPTLGRPPFNLPGVLPNPRMTLKRWNGTAFVDVATNDNWNTNSNANDIAQVASSLWAFALPNGSLDSALLLSLAPGQYTVITDDASNGQGVVILELYDADETTGGATFVNMSNRGYVGSGAEVMISGFVVSDEGPKTLLVRAVGPGLAAAPYNVPNTLSDPYIEIYRRNDDGTDTLIAAHDNWGEDGDAAFIAEASADAFAFALPNGSNDAAFVSTFAPGVYTAIVRGVGSAVGTALVEVYAID